MKIKEFNNNNGIISLVPTKIITSYLWFGYQFTKESHDFEQSQWKFNLLLVCKNWFYIISEHLEHSIIFPNRYESESSLSFIDQITKPTSYIKNIRSMKLTPHHLSTLLTRLTGQSFENPPFKRIQPAYTHTRRSSTSSFDSDDDNEEELDENDNSDDEQDQVLQPVGNVQEKKKEEIEIPPFPKVIDEVLKEIFFGKLKEIYLSYSNKDNLYDCTDYYHEFCTSFLPDCLESLSVNSIYQIKEIITPIGSHSSRFLNLTRLKLINVTLGPEVFKALEVLGPRLKMLQLRSFFGAKIPEIPFHSLYELEYLYLHTQAYNVHNVDDINALFDAGVGLCHLVSLKSLKLSLPFGNAYNPVYSKQLIDFLRFNQSIRYLKFYSDECLNKETMEYFLVENQSLTKLKLWLPDVPMPIIQNETLKELIVSISCFSNTVTSENFDSFVKSLKTTNINYFKLFHQYPIEYFKCIEPLFNQLVTFKYGVRHNNFKRFDIDAFSSLLAKCQKLEYIKLRIESVFESNKIIEQLFHQSFSKLSNLRCVYLGGPKGIISKDLLTSLQNTYNDQFFIGFNPIDNSVKVIKRK